MALLCISSLLVWRLVVRLHSRCRVWGEAEEWVAKVERVVKEKGRGECRQDENFSRELIKCSTFLSRAKPPKIWIVFFCVLTAQRRISTGGQTPLLSS